MRDTEHVDANDWHRLKTIPSQSSVIKSCYVFTDEQMQSIRQGFLPQCMNDKWFVYAASETKVFMHRSWTGHCIYELDFLQRDGEWCLDTITVNNNPAEYKKPDDVQVEFDVIDLIRGLLLSPRPAIHGVF